MGTVQHYKWERLKKKYKKKKRESQQYRKIWRGSESGSERPGDWNHGQENNRGAKGQNGEGKREAEGSLCDSVPCQNTAKKLKGRPGEKQYQQKFKVYSENSIIALLLATYKLISLDIRRQNDCITHNSYIYLNVSSICCLLGLQPHN